MENSTVKPAVSGRLFGANSDTVLLGAYALTIFISAFLLFSVQPMFAKMVLPQLGGTSAVWSVAMVFFQAVLLGGYGYAHLIVKKLPFRSAVAVHLAVLFIALAALPISVAASWGEPPESGQAFWLIGLFAVSVGLPFFAVSANGPLLQAWFARSGHPHADDPYFLYGASNIGSFASLILYVVFFETLFPLKTQAWMWAFGFAALATMIGLCALMVFLRGGASLGAGGKPDLAAPAKSAQLLSKEVSWADRGIWILLAFVPSGLLVAVTAHLTIDVASIPLLWIVPLALFLLTFVSAFATRPWLSIATLERILPVASLLAIASLMLGDRIGFGYQLAIHVVHFFLAALLAHTVLASRRPKAADLTGFYLWMSFGGVLGGIFATLAAPHMFNWLAEYPLLIVAALLLRPSFWKTGMLPLAISMGIGLVIALCLPLFLQPEVVPMVLMLGAGGALALFLVRRLGEEPLALIAVFLLCGLFVWKNGEDVLFAKRSFFGVLEAQVSKDGRFIEMVHGNTLHGRMKAEPENPPMPLSYYHSSGGIAKALFAVQSLPLETDRPREIGVVGLGTGSLICHRNGAERWTHYEIDKDVVLLARDARFFNFMQSCEKPDDRMVIGDARLTLRKEPAGFFDYLLLDAFSSNSIPVHLITKEAISLYFEKMRKNGVVAMHISNRYMDLGPVVAEIANELGVHIRIGTFWPGEADLREGAKPSMVVAMSKSPETISRLPQSDGWQVPKPGSTAVWTDDYSNVLSAIWNKASRGDQKN